MLYLGNTEDGEQRSLTDILAMEYRQGWESAG